MKKILIILLLAGCSKDKDAATLTTSGDNKYCWSCEVSRWTDGVQFHVDTCWRHDYAPQFKDENGNDENSICNPK